MRFLGLNRVRDARPSCSTGLLGFFGAGRRRPSGRAAKLLTGLTVAALLGSTGLIQPVHACSVIDNSIGGPFLGVRSKNDGALPRNAAFLWKGPSKPPADEVALAYDPTSMMRIMGHVVRPIALRASVYQLNPSTVFMAKPDQPLPLNADITITDQYYLTTSYSVGDYIDETPPEMPRITGGAIQHIEAKSGCEKEEDTCGSGPWTNLQFSIAERPKDDHTPDTHVTYAVYLERSAAEARAATTPLVLLSGPVPMQNGSLSHFMQLDESWSDADAFISVSALDMAGNESPRSEPYQVNAASSGCAVSLHQRRSSLSVGTFLTLAALAWARRRSRARAIAVR